MYYLINNYYALIFSNCTYSYFSTAALKRKRTEREQNRTEDFGPLHMMDSTGHQCLCQSSRMEPSFQPPEIQRPTHISESFERQSTSLSVGALLHASDMSRAKAKADNEDNTRNNKRKSHSGSQSHSKSGSQSYSKSGSQSHAKSGSQSNSKSGSQSNAYCKPRYNNENTKDQNVISSHMCSHTCTSFDSTYSAVGLSNEHRTTTTTTTTNNNNMGLVSSSQNNSNLQYSSHYELPPYINDLPSPLDTGIFKML